jgi:hypothetical protein
MIALTLQIDQLSSTGGMDTVMHECTMASDEQRLTFPQVATS